jgi:hypothetical protein
MFVFPGSGAEKRIFEESSGEMKPLTHRLGQIRIESQARTLAELPQLAGLKLGFSRI